MKQLKEHAPFSIETAASAYTIGHPDNAVPTETSEIRFTIEVKMRPVSTPHVSGHLFSAGSRCARPLLFRSAFAFTLAICAGSAMAQAPAAGSNWDHLKALPPDTRLHVSADKGGHTCRLVSVDDTSLVCGKRTFPRAEVKQVRLTRYKTSYAAGAAIGAGVGAGIFVGVNSQDKGNFIYVNQGEAAGAGLAVGAVIGTLVTGPADLFSGPTVYRRQ